MQPGIHVVEKNRLAYFAGRGLSVPEPWMGILDVLRMVEGFLPEPLEGEPLGVMGLASLVRASPGEACADLLLGLRAGLLAGRRYFEWKRIPLVVLVGASVTDRQDGRGLVLEEGARRVPLAPLFGTRLKPVGTDGAGWWWSPQLG